MATKKLTIKRIAELAGVSKATVSRVLNNYPHISQEVRDKVMRVVKETGYQRNAVARMLASDRSHMIGLLIPSGGDAVFTDPYFPELTHGISKAVRASTQTLALFLSESEAEGEDTIRTILAAGLLDGLIVTVDYKDYDFAQMLRGSEMPFVFIGRPSNSENVSYIDTDNFGGGFQATEYLIKKGYRRIAVIGSDKNTSGDDRYQGYRSALAKHDIPYQEALTAYGDFRMPSGSQCMDDLLPHEPDAVFVTSDTMALGAMRLLRERGLRVPDDIAIVGYDDLSPAIQADPQLTTIRQPINQQGSLAVETLLQIINNPERPPRQISLPTQLIVRGSA